MAKPIMIQGTMSNAGKSLIAAALCRIFRQDGYSAAPFKSQNMALNSYITAEGLEMGRAQVMQAEAAGVEPSVLMNPILLKPTSDVGSQVIVNGEVIGNMRAMEYFRRKREFIPQIMAAYDTLSAQHDIIVIEGAGSPAELNLKADDIVNMGMARLAKSPVVLVGDIDRGGVFAQLIGTVKLLEPSEQDMIKALIVNKFRGDRSIFRSGVEILEQRSGKPVADIKLHGFRCILAVFRGHSPVCHEAGAARKSGYDNPSRDEKHHLRHEVAPGIRTGSRAEKGGFIRCAYIRDMRRISAARRRDFRP